MKLSPRNRILAISGGSAAVVVAGVCTAVALAATPVLTASPAVVPTSIPAVPTTSSETAALPVVPIAVPVPTTTTTTVAAPTTTTVVKAAPVVPKPPVVPGCENGCQTVFRVSLPNNAHLDGLRGTTPQGWQTAVLAYWIGDRLAGHSGLEGSESRPDDDLLAAACHPSGAAERCVVSFYTGAHSASAILLKLSQDKGIQITDSALGGSPGVELTDLDHDGVKDVVLKNSTYLPYYAVAPQYWETLLDRDGRFVRTGCTVPTMERTPAPTAPVTGSCQSFS